MTIFKKLEAFCGSNKLLSADNKQSTSYLLNTFYVLYLVFNYMQYFGIFQPARLKKTTK